MTAQLGIQSSTHATQEKSSDATTQVMTAAVISTQASTSTPRKTVTTASACGTSHCADTSATLHTTELDHKVTSNTPPAKSDQTVRTQETTSTIKFISQFSDSTQHPKETETDAADENEDILKPWDMITVILLAILTTLVIAIVFAAIMYCIMKSVKYGRIKRRVETPILGQACEPGVIDDLFSLDSVELFSVEAHAPSILRGMPKQGVDETAV